MSTRQVVKWFKAYRDSQPHSNGRFNPLVLDFRSNENLGGSAMVNAIAAVRRVVGQYPAPYTLLISGGADSQVMLWAWLQSGVPFSAVHYTYGSNTQDTAWAIQFCAQHSIPLDVREFNVHKFINSPDLIDMAKRYDCTSPQILSYIRFVQDHPETCVMAGNFVQAQSAGINWTIYGLERFSRLDKPNFVPFFLLSTPRLAYSFYNFDVKYKYELYENGTIRDDYTTKIRSYKSAGFPIIPQTEKLTGFEEIKVFYDSFHVPLNLRLQWADMPSKRPFDLLYRYSLYQHIGGKYSETSRLIHHEAINTRVPQP